MKTIAIIGGGFSGTMTAVNLARLSDHPLRVVIINSKRPLGRGTAYGTSRSEHLLNVAARNMSALPDFPSHFLDWLRSRSEFKETPDQELRELFVPRRVYGDYLHGEESSQSGDLVINCTGPQSRFSQTGLPLFDNLLRKGLVRSDELDLGIQVDENFAAIGSDGKSSRLLYAIGPLLKGSLWETTAVPELRGQAMRVAENLLRREPVTVEEADVIEYYI